MSDLDDLIAAVEAGTAGDDNDKTFDAAFPEDGFLDAIDAFEGSLDAALRLHEALLPGWSARTIAQTDGGNWFVHVVNGFPTSYSREAKTGYDEVISTPARAWLLSILRALKAQEGRE